MSWSCGRGLCGPCTLHQGHCPWTQLRKWLAVFWGEQFSAAASSMQKFDVRYCRPTGWAAFSRRPDALHPGKTIKRSGERMYSLNRSFFVFIMPVGSIFSHPHFHAETRWFYQLVCRRRVQGKFPCRGGAGVKPHIAPPLSLHQRDSVCCGKHENPPMGQGAMPLVTDCNTCRIRRGGGSWPFRRIRCAWL